MDLVEKIADFGFLIADLKAFQLKIYNLQSAMLT